MFVFGKADEERAASEKNSKAATFAGQLALIFGALVILRAACVDGGFEWSVCS